MKESSHSREYFQRALDQLLPSIKSRYNALRKIDNRIIPMTFLEEAEPYLDRKFKMLAKVKSGDCLTARGRENLTELSTAKWSTVLSKYDLCERRT